MDIDDLDFTIFQTDVKFKSKLEYLSWIDYKLKTNNIKTNISTICTILQDLNISKYPISKSDINSHDSARIKNILCKI
jgi:hypothetical protein